MIIGIFGPSGSGKTTLKQWLIDGSVVNAAHLLSVTTRPARASDPEGEYRYASNEEFDALQSAKKFCWTVDVAGNRYGTLYETLEHALPSPDLYVGALVPEGVRALYRYAKKRHMLRRVCWIWLDTDKKGELAARMRKRGDKEADIQRRVLEAQDWQREWKEMSLRNVLLLDAFRPQNDHHPKVLEYLQTKMPHS